MSYRVLDVVFMGEMVGVSKSGKKPAGSDSSSSAQGGTLDISREAEGRVGTHNEALQGGKCWVLKDQNS